MAAFAHHDALAGVGEVGQGVEALLSQRVKLVDDRSQGHREQQVFAVGAVALGPLAVRAALSLKVMFKPVVDQRGLLGVGNDDDVAATAAVAAVGAAFGNVGLAAKRHAASAAVATRDVDPNLIDEHSHSL